MNDRELLEYAAKAAGYKFKFGTDWHNNGLPQVNGKEWNPLTDDGDALRLAIKLNMEICFDEDNWNSLVIIKTKYGQIFDIFAPDKNSATRRAIVRAAAEIGKTK